MILPPSASFRSLETHEVFWGNFLKLPCKTQRLGLVVRHGYVRFDPCTFLRQRRLQFSEWLGPRSNVIPAMEFCSWISMFMHQSCWWSSIAGNFTSNREQNKLKCERICEKTTIRGPQVFKNFFQLLIFFKSKVWVTYLHNEKRMLEAKKSVRFSGEICNMPERDCVLENPGRTGNERVYSCFPGLAYRANPLRTLDVVHRMPEIPNLPSKMWRGYETNVLNRGVTSYSLSLPFLP